MLERATNFNFLMWDAHPHFRYRKINFSFPKYFQCRDPGRKCVVKELHKLTGRFAASRQVFEVHVGVDNIFHVAVHTARATRTSRSAPVKEKKNTPFNAHHYTPPIPLKTHPLSDLAERPKSPKSQKSERKGSGVILAYPPISSLAVFGVDSIAS